MSRLKYPVSNKIQNWSIPRIWRCVQIAFITVSGILFQLQRWKLNSNRLSKKKRTIKIPSQGHPGVHPVPGTSGSGDSDDPLGALTPLHTWADLLTAWGRGLSAAWLLISRAWQIRRETERSPCGLDVGEPGQNPMVRGRAISSKAGQFHQRKREYVLSRQKQERHTTTTLN